MKTRRQILTTKVYGKIYKEKYLAELRASLTVPVDENRFMSVEDTDCFMNDKREYGRTMKATVPFLDKITLLKEVIASIYDIDTNPILYWTSYSEYCGVYLMPSIATFNSNFDDFYIGGGLIALLSFDQSNKMLLDFYDEDGGDWLDIEVFGTLWCSAISDIADFEQKI